MLHRLLDSRASCVIQRPPHSSGRCPLGSSVEASESSVSLVPAWVSWRGWQLSRLCHCSPAWSVSPLGLLCCAARVLWLPIRPLTVRVTLPGPLMSLWMSMAMCLAGDLWCPWLLLPLGCSGGCLGLSYGGTVSVSRADSSPLWVHTVCPCVNGPPALMSICAHCHSVSRADQCSHQGYCQRESSATTIARAALQPRLVAVHSHGRAAWLPWSSSLSRRARLLRVAWGRHSQTTSTQRGESQRDSLQSPQSLLHWSARSRGTYNTAPRPTRQLAHWDPGDRDCGSTDPDPQPDGHRGPSQRRARWQPLTDGGI